MSAPLLALALDSTADGRASMDANAPASVVIASPTVGTWRGIPQEGDVLRAGQSLGHINTAGKWHQVVLPQSLKGIALGRVIQVAQGGDGRRPVLGYGDVMVILAADGLDAGGTQQQARGDAALGTVFVAPSSGRFYARPAPDKPAFVEVGQTIKRGDVVCIVEVMKTFTRVTFDGPTVPDRARITRLVPEDGDDLEAGVPILEFEAEG